MLLLNDGKIQRVSDDRIKTVQYSDYNKELSAFRDVYIDGLLYMRAVPVYIEHKQYIMLETAVEDSVLLNLFKDQQNVVFIDIGVRDGDNDREIYKDYSAKAREGISYFNDVITHDDKVCTFKKNYIRMEARL